MRQKTSPYGEYERQEEFLMVGQLNNIKFLQTCADNKCFPRFMIITGEKGSGKKTLASYIAKHLLRAITVYPGNGVEAVREAINNSYKCAGTTVYIFPDADKMSTQAKNAMLKITEEPPRQAYFIMTVESINNTLSTLKSRGTEIQMESYSDAELESLLDTVSKEDRLAIRIASNPGQLYQLREIDTEEFYTFCKNVLNFVAVVTGVNAFKIGNSLKFKEDGNGYDPILFFECIKAICAERSRISTDSDELIALRNTIRATNEYKRDFSLTGVKKDSTFDMWILEMRDIWKGVYTE